MAITDSTPQTARSLQELADALEITLEELKRVRETSYFPDKELCYDATAKVWKVDVIAAALREAAGMEASQTDMPNFVTARDQNGNSLLLIKTREARFDARCPNENKETGPTHSVRVKPGGTKGRIRYCMCDTCGHQFQAAGDYADIRLETLRRIRSVLESAEVGEMNGSRFIVMTDDCRLNICDLISQVMQRADNAKSLTTLDRGADGKFE